MISRSFIRQLKCPYCDGSLVVEHDGNDDGSLEYGVVRCDCYRYAIVGGILILRQISPPAHPHDPIVAHLDDGAPKEALQTALRLGSAIPPVRSRRQTWLSRLRRVHPYLSSVPERFLRPDPTRTTDYEECDFPTALARLRVPIYAEYLYYRYCSPSFLAAIPLILVSKEIVPPGGRVLDLGCGVGHATWYLSGLVDDIEVVSCDHDFVNLFLARRYIAPDSQHVCVDAEKPLPFADDLFSGVYVVDALHYIRSKSALAHELGRCVKDDGIIVFSHLHNRDAENVNPGQPLTLTGYLRCFAKLHPRLFDERDILSRFTREGCVDLSKASSPDELADAQAVSLVASRCEDVLRRYDNVSDMLRSHPDRLLINPIYSSRRKGETVMLSRLILSDPIEAEIASATLTPPATLELSCEVFDALRRSDVAGLESATLQRLIRCFALISVPPAYRSRRPHKFGKA
jgi:SAM-dependent methyltransferase